MTIEREKKKEEKKWKEIYRKEQEHPKLAEFLGFCNLSNLIRDSFPPVDSGFLMFQ